MKLITSGKQVHGSSSNPDTSWSVSKIDIHKLAGASLAAYDVETTGTDPFEARIVQAAIVIDVPGQEYDIRSWLVDPGCEIPLGATAIHGISTEHAQTNGVQPKIALRELLTAFRELSQLHAQAICAYNSVYDLTVLDCELERNGMGNLSIVRDIGVPVIDPLICDRKLDTYRSGRRTLTAVSSAYGVVVSQAHQAHGDCITTIKLARAMEDRYPGLGCGGDWSQLQIMQRDAQHEFAAHFENYKRAADPDFSCNGEWPIMARTGCLLATSLSSARQPVGLSGPS